MARPAKRVEDVFFPGAVTYRDAEWGDITVGGDLGDVKIEWAGPGEDDAGNPGVWCKGVHLISTIVDEEDDDEYLQRLAEEIILFSYESIGGETFCGKIRWT